MAVYFAEFHSVLAVQLNFIKLTGLWIVRLISIDWLQFWTICFDFSELTRDSVQRSSISLSSLNCTICFQCPDIRYWLIQINFSRADFRFWSLYFFLCWHSKLISISCDIETPFSFFAFFGRCRSLWISLILVPVIWLIRLRQQFFVIYPTFPFPDGKGIRHGNFRLSLKKKKTALTLELQSFVALANFKITFSIGQIFLKSKN